MEINSLVIKNDINKEKIKNWRSVFKDKKQDFR